MNKYTDEQTALIQEQATRLAEALERIYVIARSDRTASEVRHAVTREAFNVMSLWVGK